MLYGCASCTGSASDECTSCTSGFYLQPSPNLNVCNTTCPSPYVPTTVATCGKCSSLEMKYYNHTCVSTCPITTYSALNEYDNEYECQPCYIGCDTCQDGTKYTCLTCSAGFYYYYNNTCSNGCPPDMYANPQTRVCDQCQDPCTTCSQPNNYSCTNCPQNYLLLNGTCVTSCPSTYYQGFHWRRRCDPGCCLFTQVIAVFHIESNNCSTHVRSASNSVIVSIPYYLQFVRDCKHK